MEYFMSRNTFESHIITLFTQLHPLDRIHRAGFLLRGVSECESIASHMHFVSLLTLLYTEQYPDYFNKEKAVTMALIHDLPEAILMDIPMPVTDTYLKEKKEKAENEIFKSLFNKFSRLFDNFSVLYKELIDKETKESRLVAGLA